MPAQVSLTRTPLAADVQSGAVHVLVVDDDERLRELLSLYLWREGYEVRLAEDAVEAGRAIVESTPDIMIVDVSMPYMGGFEFVAAVRADRAIPFFPVIFLSEHANSASRARGFGVGATCLLKPVERDRLLAAVASIRRPQPQPVAGEPHENRDSLNIGGSSFPIRSGRREVSWSTGGGQ